MGFWGKHLISISQEMRMKVCNMNEEITLLKLLSYLPGNNELM